jgi:serine/threonine-protein kinase
MLHCPKCGRQFSDGRHLCPDDFTPLEADATIADAPVDPLIGRTFEGKYRLDQRLGSGGMGTVYRATHLLIDRPVAIKVLSQRFMGDETAQQRFRREARAAGRMQHPNAVTVTDFGASDDGYLYIVMELLEGCTLRDLMAREAPLDLARAVSIMLQACTAVGAAHDAGLIHRDLKPANIFVEQRPNLPSIVKVLDFGVAKLAVSAKEDEDFKTLTQVGALIGTPRYMSPEQCTGAATLTGASDVYSLGIILYEMLTGAVPFSADTPLAVAMKQVSEPPRPLREVAPQIPEVLEHVVLHALAKTPEGRPADANAFRRELLATAEQLGLERADLATTPSMDTVRQAATESPSGRLVVDLARLRQVQAASSGDNQPTVATSVTNAAASTGTVAVNLTATNQPARPEFNRMQVPLNPAPGSPTHWRMKIVGMLVLGLVAGAGLLAIANHFRSSPSTQITNQSANQGASQSANQSSQGSPSTAPNTANAASPQASPGGSPQPSPSAQQANHARNDNRDEEARKSDQEPKNANEKKSKVGSIVKKIKGIFK